MTAEQAVRVLATMRTQVMAHRLALRGLEYECPDIGAAVREVWLSSGNTLTALDALVSLLSDVVTAGRQGEEGGRHRA